MTTSQAVAIKGTHAHTFSLHGSLLLMNDSIREGRIHGVERETLYLLFSLVKLFKPLRNPFLIEWYVWVSIFTLLTCVCKRMLILKEV